MEFANILLVLQPSYIYEVTYCIKVTTVLQVAVFRRAIPCLHALVALAEIYPQVTSLVQLVEGLEYFPEGAIVERWQVGVGVQTRKVSDTVIVRHITERIFGNDLEDLRIFELAGHLPADNDLEKAAEEVHDQFGAGRGFGLWLILLGQVGLLGKAGVGARHLITKGVSWVLV